MILEMRDVHTYYGTSHVLFGVSLDVSRGETVCLMGRNGAGKTTTFRSIVGLTPPRSGSILFQGKEIAGGKVHRIARLGPLIETLQTSIMRFVGIALDASDHEASLVDLRCIVSDVREQ